MERRPHEHAPRAIVSRVEWIQLARQLCAVIQSAFVRIARERICARVRRVDENSSARLRGIDEAVAIGVGREEARASQSFVEVGQPVRVRIFTLGQDPDHRGAQWRDGYRIEVPTEYLAAGHRRTESDSDRSARVRGEGDLVGAIFAIGRRSLVDDEGVQILERTIVDRDDDNPSIVSLPFGLEVVTESENRRGVPSDREPGGLENLFGRGPWTTIEGRGPHPSSALRFTRTCAGLAPVPRAAGKRIHEASVVALEVARELPRTIGDAHARAILPAHRDGARRASGQSNRRPAANRANGHFRRAPARQHFAELGRRSPIGVADGDERPFDVCVCGETAVLGLEEQLDRHRRLRYP